MKICFITSQDGASGTALRWGQLARGLAARGNQVTVFSQSSQPGWRYRSVTEMREGVEYRITPSFPGNGYIDYSINPLNLARYRLRTLPEADVYHLFQPFANAALTWLSARRSRPDALHIWDWDDLWAGGLIRNRSLLFHVMNRMEHLLPRCADAITTCSEYLKSLALNRGAPAGKVIWNGFSKAAQLDKKLLRDKYALPHDKILILFMGWTPTETEWIYRGYSEAKAAGLPVALVWIGIPPQRVPGFDPTYETHYLGQLPQAEALRAAQACDIGLLPLADTPFNQSRMPMKFADYLALGLKVCASAVGELSTISKLMPERVALSFPAETDWKTSLQSMVRAQMGDSEKQSAVELPSALGWNSICRDLEEFYLEKIRQRAHRSVGHQVDKCPDLV